jgi:quinol monooxygenase YgiN
MNVFIFARFHAREGEQDALANVLREQVGRVREEPGCLAIDAFRSTGDPRLFYIHSRWTNKAAFETHAALPRTEDFVARAQALIDHPFEATRAAILR